MYFSSPKFRVLDTPNSAYYARIMPNYAQLCRLTSQRRQHIPAGPTSRAHLTPATAGAVTSAAAAASSCRSAGRLGLTLVDIRA